MGCEECSKINIPEHLCEHEKLKPLEFDKENELLYRRHKHVGNTQELKALSESEVGSYIFKLNDDSYNRSHISNLPDVLLNDEPSESKDVDYYKLWGVISIPVSHVNNFSEELFIDNKKRKATMKVAHTSKKCNYSHSEIFCYLDDQKTNGQPPKSARPFFRRSLQTLIKAEIEYKDIAI